MSNDQDNSCFRVNYINGVGVYLWQVFIADRHFYCLNSCELPYQRVWKQNSCLWRWGILRMWCQKPARFIIHLFLNKYLFKKIFLLVNALIYINWTFHQLYTAAKLWSFEVKAFISSTLVFRLFFTVVFLQVFSKSHGRGCSKMSSLRIWQHTANALGSRWTNLTGGRSSSQKPPSAPQPSPWRMSPGQMKAVIFAPLTSTLMDLGGGRPASLWRVNSILNLVRPNVNTSCFFLYMF